MKKLFTTSLLVLIGFTLTGCTLVDKAKQDVQDTQNKIETTAKTNLEDIFSNNQPKECTYSNMVEGNETSGTMYINGQKIAHFMKIKGEMTQELNYIMKDDWMYSWGNDSKIPAMKLQLSELAKLAPKDNTEEVEDTEKIGDVDYKDLGLETGLNLSCKDWNVDESKFTPPSDVDFTDVTKTMKDFTEKFNQTTEKVKDITDSKCAACNMAPDENLKKECLASLGCN